MAFPNTTNTTRPLSFGYDVRIGTEYYRLVPNRELKREDEKLQVEQITAPENPEDLRQSFGAIFSRSDFSGGGRLRYAHRPGSEERGKTRYWDSFGLDIDFFEEGSSVLRTARSLNTTSTGDTAYPQGEGYRIRGGLEQLQGSLFAIGGSAREKLLRIDNPTSTNPTITGEGSGIFDTLSTLTSDHNDTLYISAIDVNDGNRKVFQRVGGSITIFSEQDAAILKYVKDRLVGSVGNQFWHIKSGTTSVEIFRGTSPIVDIEDAGQAILAVSKDGEFYAVTVNDAGDLELSAQSSLIQETVNWVSIIADKILVGTGQENFSNPKSRLYLCELTQANTLEIIDVIEEFKVHNPGGGGSGLIATTGGVRGITFHRGDAYFAVEADADVWDIYKWDGTENSIYRIYRETAEVIVDINVVNGAVCYIDNGTKFVNQLPNSYVTDAYLITPLADFFSADEKSWVGTRLNVEGIDGNNSTATLSYTTNEAAIEDRNHVDWNLVKTYSTADTSEERISARSRYLALMIEFSPDAAITEPVELNSVSARAFPGNADIGIDMIINCSDRIERPYHKSFMAEGLGYDIYDHLTDFRGQPVEIEILHKEDVYFGIVERISALLGESRQGSHSMFARVKFRGQLVSQ